MKLDLDLRQVRYREDKKKREIEQKNDSEASLDVSSDKASRAKFRHSYILCVWHNASSNRAKPTDIFVRGTRGMSMPCSDTYLLDSSVPRKAGQDNVRQSLISMDGLFEDTIESRVANLNLLKCWKLRWSNQA